VDPIRSLNQSIAESEKTIAGEGRKLEGHKDLISIKGIGPLTRSILLSVTGDTKDVADEGKLAAYFGIVPRVSKSNETEHAGRITKRGGKLVPHGAGAMRADRAAVQPVSKRHYEKVKARRGTGKAVIALARKLQFSLPGLSQSSFLRRP
jgi:transposase